jgi:hypothetical protein
MLRAMSMMKFRHHMASHSNWIGSCILLRRNASHNYWCTLIVLGAQLRYRFRNTAPAECARVAIVLDLEKLNIIKEQALLFPKKYELDTIKGSGSLATLCMMK